MTTDNGTHPDTVELPRPLLQAILDVLGRLPAGEVYPLLKALDAELGISHQPQPQPVDAA